MTGAAMLTMMMARMNRTNATLRAKALLEVILYQQTVLEKGPVLPDFLITRKATVALSAADNRFTLPSDFLRELDEDETLWIVDDNSEHQPMVKCDDDDVEARFTSDDTGSLPLEYKIEGLYGYTYPIPTVARTLKLSYYGTGATIADDAVETVWLKHAPDLILGGAGLIVNSIYVKDPEATLIFAGLEAKGMKRLLDEQTARAEAGRTRRMG